MGNPHFLSGGIEAQGGDREPEKLQLLPAATNQNIAEFLSDFVSLYGEKRWGVSMYDSQNSLIANYINPIIGDMKVQDITTRVVDKYIQTLQKTPAVNTRRTTPNGVCHQRYHREDHQTSPLCLQAGGSVELVAKNPFGQCGAAKSGIQEAGHLDC